MKHSFDNFGWYSPEEIPGRTTEVTPPGCGERIEGQPYPNFTGYQWILLEYHYAELPAPGPEPGPGPLPVPVSPLVTIITKFQFMSRLTIAERLAIYAAEAGSPMIRMWLEMFKICEEIDTTNTDTITGIQMLEQSGLIATGRAAEILGTNAPNT
jgi:hypothetical protein